MKILLTGSSGRIGRAIYRQLAERHDLVCLDLIPSATTDLVASISDHTAITKVMDGVDAVIHVAALHAPHVGLRSEEEFRLLNVQSTLALARLAQNSGVRKFVFTSTTALYGEASSKAGRAAWITEATVPEPRTIYHQTKLQAETGLKQLSEDTGLSVSVIRMSRCFPEPVTLMAPYRLHRGIDARDVARAHVLALDFQEASFSRFIISGKTPFLEEDCEELFLNAPAVIAKRCPELFHAFKQRQWPLPRSIDRVYDSSLATKKLGWQPRYGFEEIISQFDALSSEVLPIRSTWLAVE